MPLSTLTLSSYSRFLAYMPTTMLVQNGHGSQTLSTYCLSHSHPNSPDNTPASCSSSPFPPPVPPSVVGRGLAGDFLPLPPPPPPPPRPPPPPPASLLLSLMCLALLSCALYVASLVNFFLHASQYSDDAPP